MTDTQALIGKPWILRRTGEVIHRQGGHVIGRVTQSGGMFGGWHGEEISFGRVGLFGSRQVAAREVWNRYAKRTGEHTWAGAA